MAAVASVPEETLGRRRRLKPRSPSLRHAPCIFPSVQIYTGFTVGFRAAGLNCETIEAVSCRRPSLVLVLSLASEISDKGASVCTLPEAIVSQYTTVCRLVLFTRSP